MRSRFSAIISSVQSKEAPDRPCYGVSQTCPDVLRRRFRGFCTVFGFSLFGRVGVYSGISQWYRVGDAGALRAEPLATLCLARSKEIEVETEAHTTHMSRSECSRSLRHGRRRTVQIGRLSGANLVHVERELAYSQCANALSTTARIERRAGR